MAENDTQTAEEVRARLVEHLDDTVALVDALDPSTVDEDLWSAVERAHKSTGALLKAAGRW